MISWDLQEIITALVLRRLRETRVPGLSNSCQAVNWLPKEESRQKHSVNMCATCSSKPGSLRDPAAHTILFCDYKLIINRFHSTAFCVNSQITKPAFVSVYGQHLYMII